MTHDGRLLLMGCGILKQEIGYLIEKNNWPLDTIFFDSSLHCKFDRFSHVLTTGLAKHQGRPNIVFYGTCHPLMEKMLDKAKTFRTEGQNCVDMLLGYELFMKELTKGAFFLLEEWSRRWESIQKTTFGTTNVDIIREIFCYDRKYLLCLRTPCSGDFKADAEAAGKMMGLPLQWMDVTLDHLESVLRTAINRKNTELQCQRE